MASLDISGNTEGAESSQPKHDHRLSGWFWDHENWFCRHHVERDRQRRIEQHRKEDLLRAEQPRATVVQQTALEPQGAVQAS